MTATLVPGEVAAPSRAVLWLGRLAWLYLLGLLAVWGLLALASDEWWPATFLMFSPRWIWGLPLLILLPPALWYRGRPSWLLVVCLGLVVGPIMGLCIPWRTWFASEGDPAASIRILSLNTHRRELDRGALALLLLETEPDLVVLQDWSGRYTEALFPKDLWHVRNEGQFGLASRLPIHEVELARKPASCQDAFCRYVVETRAGLVTVFSVHLQTPRDGLGSVVHGGWGAELEKNSDRRREQAAAGTRWMREAGGRVLIAGDFNTTTESSIYADHWSSWTNAFSTAGWGWGCTYRNKKNRTLIRIDHILTGPGWQCRNCWVGPEVGSEHRPLLADVAWVGE